MIYLFFLDICINEQSPGVCREIAREEVLPLVFLFQLLHVGCLLHVNLVAILVIEMIFKI